MNLAAQPLSSRRLNVALLSAAALALLSLAVFAWLSDFFSLQGERVVYTADCVGGDWVGDRCSGSARAGDRYRFRALKDRREVVIKRLGSAEQERRMTNCDVVSGRDWSCNADGHPVKSVVYTMVRGEAVAESTPESQSTRCVSKVRWLTLQSRTRTSEVKGQ